MINCVKFVLNECMGTLMMLVLWCIGRCLVILYNGNKILFINRTVIEILLNDGILLVLKYVSEERKRTYSIM